ncbi:DNA mismatch repair protein Mlh1 [Marasmius crinis-equi]|uniref:DNA mismatch repair protein Mlh1 n=1 Tax=Marasmius crinis-equi TaxID=585013 RepID=A0ABR3F9X7_9AGAR
MNTNEESSVEPPAPLPIRRLQESLINRIAAGEIIHRPASALKELLENSLDAGATSIRVVVKDGGLKLLQIQDNGCGIRKADLPILAERFTTSKLSTFSDLSKLTTYGFRGEALASISHVAHLSVTTKTRSEVCAYKAHYSDGKLVPNQPGLATEPKPCAGNDGTIIMIEDLFYNTPTRLSALRNTSDEYARILDVVTKYAVHNPKVSFSCKKVGTSTPDISTATGSKISQVIRMLYGHSIEKELLNIEVSSPDKTKSDETWSAEAYFTSANYQAKKTTFLLFINHRLVESSRIKRALEGVYTGILPKGAFPFIYLSLEVNPRAVDVNVHPTKKEVHFLNEELITERICDSLTDKLAEKNSSRTFEYQTLLTGGRAEETSKSNKKRKGQEIERDSDVEEENTQKAGPSKVYSHKKVRTSLQDRTLDSMFPVANPSHITGASGSKTTKSGIPATPVSRYREVKESDCNLTSVNALRRAIIKKRHKSLTEILEKHTFVGIVDLDRCLSLVQHSTKLYLVNHGALAAELFYQLGLRQFGDMSRLKLDPPPPLRKLIEIAVEAEETEGHTMLSKPQIVERIHSILFERREMLAEYFSLNISSIGLVESLPLLLRDYTPNLDKLPQFLMRLGPQVNWTSETECFDTFLRELANFYVPGPLVTDKAAAEEESAVEKAEKWQIQHVLFPAMRRYLLAPKTLLDDDVVQVADLPDLYKAKATTLGYSSSENRPYIFSLGNIKMNENDCLFTATSQSRWPELQATSQNAISSSQRDITQSSTHEETDFNRCQAPLSNSDADIPDLERRHERMEEAIDSCRSPLSPIHELPPELLSRIFAYVCDDSAQLIGVQIQSPDVVSLSRVCGRWREITLSIASLWSTFTADFGYFLDDSWGARSATHLFLERSQSNPLVLDLTLNSPRIVDAEPLLVIFTELTDAAHRWKSVQLNIESDLFSHPAFQSMALPASLKHLDLSLVSLVWDEQPIRVFESCPALESLSLRGLAADYWDKFILPWSRLMKLELTGVSATFLALILALCPDLKELNLFAPKSPGLEIGSRIALDRLECLTLSRVPSGCIPYLERFFLPALSNIHIQEWYTVHNVAELNRKQFSEFLARSACTITRFRLQPPATVRDDDVIDLLRLLPSLKTLYLEEHEGHSPTPSNTVTTSTLFSELSTITFLPKLTELTLACYAKQLDVNSLMVAARSRLHSEPDSGGVARLRSLTIRAMDKRRVDLPSLEILYCLCNVGLRVDVFRH